MRRRWHWAWAALASLVVAYAVLVVWQWLCLGAPGQTEAPLKPVYRASMKVLSEKMDW